MRSTGVALFLLALTAPAAHAQPRDDARAFVTGLYSRYGHGKGPEYAGRDAPGTFTPDLVRLIRRDQTETPDGDVGALDGDPICDCQDFEGLKLVGVTVKPAVQGRASAEATIVFPDRTRRAIRLDLAQVGKTWRVADVHTADLPSLVELLRRAHPERPARR